MALQQIKASVAEAYKLEAAGLLLGREIPGGILVQGAWTIARADKRSYWEIQPGTAIAIAEPFLEEWLVGGWHSHPDERPFMGPDDKRECWDVELVVGVHRGPRKWHFKFQGYWEPTSGVWRRASIVHVDGRKP